MYAQLSIKRIPGRYASQKSRIDRSLDRHTVRTTHPANNSALLTKHTIPFVHSSVDGVPHQSMPDTPATTYARMRNPANLLNPHICTDAQASNTPASLLHYRYVINSLTASLLPTLR